MRKCKPRRLPLSILRNEGFLRDLFEHEKIANDVSQSLSERKKHRKRVKEILASLIPDLRCSKEGINFTLDLFVRYEEIKEELQPALNRKYCNPNARKKRVREIFEKWAKQAISEKELEQFLAYRRLDDLAAMIAVYGYMPKMSYHTLLARYKKTTRAFKPLRKRLGSFFEKSSTRPQSRIKQFIARIKKQKVLREAR
ncbi:MAG: hypothetical protein WC484_01780 [Candidatus Omnitrophota bacterium]